MGRLKIEIQGNPFFTFSYQVGVKDINYGGHMGNDAFVSLLQESRIQWLRSLGYVSETQIDGAGWIQADLQIVYMGECFMGEWVEVKLHLGYMSKKHIDLQYRIKKSSKIVAEASTNLLFFDYQAKKIVNIPPKFHATLLELQVID